MMKKILFLIIIIISSNFGQNSFATITEKNGTVSIRPSGDNSFSQTANMNSEIYAGDAISTNDNAYAEVVFNDDQSAVQIYENSLVELDEQYSIRTINVSHGQVRYDINKNMYKNYSLETPNSVVSVENAELIVEVNEEDCFTGISGTVDITNLITGKDATLSKGNTIVSSSDGNIQNLQTDTEPEIAYAQTNSDESTEDSPQDENKKDDDKSQDSKNWNMGLGIGSVTIDGQIYNQISLRPEIKFGKLGIGLDVYFYFDEEGKIRKDEWDEPSDYLEKIFYLRWGKQGDPFFARAGALQNITLGYGILMQGYSNAVQYPQVRNLGGHLGMKIGKFGWEVMVADVKELSGPGLVAGRMTYDFLGKLNLGGTFVADFNQYKGLNDADEDNVPDVFDAFPKKNFTLPDYYPVNAFDWNPGDRLKGKNYSKDSDRDGIPDGIDYDIDGDGLTDNYPDTLWTQEISDSIMYGLDPFNINNQAKTLAAVSFDVGYPLVNSAGFKLNIYGQSAVFISEKITDYKSGEKFSPGWGAAVPGFYAQFLGIINCNLEYRFSGENFLYNFWDRVYDVERVTIRTKSNSQNELWAYTKDEVRLKNNPMKGYFGSIDINIFDFLILGAYYQNMTSKENEIRSFRSTLTIPRGKIPKLAEAKVFYMRNNDKNPFLFDKPSENTILGYRVGFDIGGGAVLSYVFRQTYQDFDGNGIINPKKETITMNTIETGFYF